MQVCPNEHADPRLDSLIDLDRHLPPHTSTSRHDLTLYDTLPHFMSSDYRGYFFINL
jgi:hypothetical protein